MGKEKTSGAPAGKKKAKRSVSVGIAYIEATFNNTTVTITLHTKGDDARWASPPARAASRAAARARHSPASVPRNRPPTAKKYGLKEVEVKVKGPGSGRENAITSLRKPRA